MRRLIPAVGLFFLAPLIGEYLLGDLPVTALYALIALAPLYGGGALLIREVCRRAGWGWSSILVLALAYGVLEEGILTQSLFNPHYGGLDLHLLAPGYVPVLGIGVPYTLFVVTLHMVWSIGVPIALTELTTTKRLRTTPWLGRIGLVVTAALLAAGVALNFTQSRADSHFVASVPQLTGTAAVALALVALAVFLGRRHGGVRRGDSGRVPPVWLLGLACLVVTSAFVTAWYQGRNTMPPWLFVGLALAAYAAGILLVHRWSRRQAWTPFHQLALVGGALLTYAWHGFLTHPFMHTSPEVQLTSHLVFALGALALLTAATLRIRSDNGDTDPRPRPDTERAAEPSGEPPAHLDHR